MKRIVAVLLCFAVLCPALAGAEEYYDYRIHDRYFTPFAPEFFGEDDAVYHAWGDRDGDISLDWHLLWYRGGELFRDYAYPAAGGLSASLFLPREDGTCGVLLPGQKDEETGGGCAVLYEWTADGLEPAERIPGGWQGKDIKRAAGGFFAYDGSDGVLSCFDSYGKPLREIPMAERIPQTVIMGKTCRGEIAGAVGNIDGLCAVVFRTEMRSAKHSRYLAVCMDRLEEQWSRSFQYDPALIFPGDGFFWRLERNGSGAADPVKIARLDEAGRDTAARTLFSDGLVLGVHMEVSPITGLMTVYGSAVSNARGIYTVFRMQLDGDLKQVSLDVREADYFEDYSPSVLMRGDGELFVHCRGIEGVDPSTPAVLIPFDALPECGAHGIRIR
ncbi:MAG: hypothetical protein IKI84_03245 [Clostridia bacterium]|nr:hypothetical protein [Clostridia bacterium]